MKKLLLFFLFLILNGCNPTYRILTTDYDYIPTEAHKYEIIDIKTGKIDTIYDFTYYPPGFYVKLSKDSTAVFKIIDIIE